MIDRTEIEKTTLLAIEQDILALLPVPEGRIPTALLSRIHSHLHKHDRDLFLAVKSNLSPEMLPIAEKVLR